MSKYDAVWQYLETAAEDAIQLSFEEIHEIAGYPIDHSFLNVKKEASAYGYEVTKISLKDKTILFHKIKS